VGGLPIVGDLPAGLASLALLFSPLVVAFWKGGSQIRFGALPFTLIGWMLGTTQGSAPFSHAGYWRGYALH
jgi:hypothetical protein